MVLMERVIVAYGVADFSASIIHHKQVSPGNVVVSIDDCEKKYELFSLPVPTDFISEIGDAENNTEVQQGKGKHNEIGNATNESVQQGKQKSKENGNTTNESVQQGKRRSKENGNATNESVVCLKKPFYPEKYQPPISDKCKRMKSILVDLDKTETIEFQVDKGDFFLSEDQTLFIITQDDVDDILSGRWLSVSVLEVFTMALKNQYRQHFDSIGFMRPGRISSIDCQQDKAVCSEYMSNVIKQCKSKPFIFCPYWEGNHWILLVISVEKHEVYSFDPIRMTTTNRLSIKPLLDGAYLAYVQMEPKRMCKKGLTWHSAKCAQQIGSKECGNFVMRYMFEIVLHYRDSENLIRDFTITESYREDEISEVLDVWAKECVSTIMSR
ncbi:hypothetical protein M5689_003259 [Euphorbia peplus]|nr:hypothetical protein M5689_003259 [Euphorbia peplus]